MNCDIERIVIIGVGSPHGDDQFGWTVVNELRPTLDLHSPFQLQKVNNPIDLIASLDQYNRVIVIDAAIGMPSDVCFRKLKYADLDDRALIDETCAHGSHDVGISFVLRLAESLGKRTEHVELWIGNAQCFDPCSPMSHELTIAAKRCATKIARGVCDARTIAG